MGSKCKTETNIVEIAKTVAKWITMSYRSNVGNYFFSPTVQCKILKVYKEQILMVASKRSTLRVFPKCLQINDIYIKKMYLFQMHLKHTHNNVMNCSRSQCPCHIYWLRKK